MAEFIVKLADERGRILKQSVEQASSAAEIRERYAAQDLIVYDIKPAGMFGNAGLGRRKKVPLEKFVIFNSQFVTLIKAGLPILTALDLLGKQQRDQYFKSVLADVRNRVKGGEYLSTAFEVQNITGKIYSTTLLAGEKSGNLEEVLNRYISFQRISIAFRKKLIASLIYPALLVVMMIALFTVLIVFVVPRFGALYKELNAELPPVTQLLIAIGNNAQKYSIISVIVVVASGLLFWQWKRSKVGSETLDRMFYKAPLIGEVILKYHVAMFARMMSTLLGGGLPLVQALETAGSSIDSPIIARGMIDAANRVREGNSLSVSLRQVALFPELSIEMVEVGESTGALPGMLTSVAEFYEEDVQTGLAAALTLIEPIMLIVMGTVVATIIISLYLPILTLGANSGAH